MSELSPEISPNRIRSRTRRLLMTGVVSFLILGIGFLVWWWVDPGIPAWSARASFQAHPRAILTWYTSGNYERPAVVLAFSPDGRLLATGGEDHQVKIWDTTQGSLVRALPFRGKVEWVGFSADGSHLVAEGHGSIPALWNQVAAEAPAPPMPPVPTAPAPPMPPVPTASAPSMPPGMVAPPGPESPPSQPDEATAQVWTVADGVPLGPAVFIPPRRRLVREGGIVKLASFAPTDDPRVAIWADAIRRDDKGLWGLLDARPTLVSHDEHHLATGGSGDVWLTHADGRPEAQLTGRLYRAPALAFASVGHRFAAGSATGGITIRDLDSGQETNLPTPDGRTPLAFSPDGRLLAYVGHRLSVTPPGWYHHLPLLIQRALRPLVIQGNGYDDKDMAALWDCQTGALRAVLPGHQAEIYSITFADDGHLLATADWEGQVRIWPAW